MCSRIRQKKKKKKKASALEAHVPQEKNKNGFMNKLTSIC